MSVCSLSLWACRPLEPRVRPHLGHTLPHPNRCSLPWGPVQARELGQTTQVTVPSQTGKPQPISAAEVMYWGHLATPCPGSYVTSQPPSQWLPAAVHLFLLVLGVRGLSVAQLAVSHASVVGWWSKVPLHSHGRQVMLAGLGLSTEGRWGATHGFSMPLGLLTIMAAESQAEAFQERRRKLQGFL